MNPIQTTILEKLADIEKRYPVKILYACESGSRAWGFPSPDSDYDVRFIYAFEQDTYLSFLPEKDIIELPVNEVLDITGWDLRKAIQLTMKRNITLYEWLQSPIVYREMEGFRDGLWKLIREGYSPVSSVFHYLSLARNSMEAGLQGEEVKLKKYFYVLRALLTARWAADKLSVPPMEFRPLLALLQDRPDLVATIEDLLERKKTADEKTLIPVQAALQQYIEEEFERISLVAKTLPAGSSDGEALSAFFIQTIRSLPWKN